MAGTTGNMKRERQRPGSLPTRLLWFVGLWLAGVAAVALLSLLLRRVLL